MYLVCKRLKELSDLGLVVVVAQNKQSLLFWSLIDSLLSVVLICPNELFVTLLIIDMDHSLDFSNVWHFLTSFCDCDRLFDLVQTLHQFILRLLCLQFLNLQFIQYCSIVYQVSTCFGQLLREWRVENRQLKFQVIDRKSVNWFKPVKWTVFVSQKFIVLTWKTLFLDNISAKTTGNDSITSSWDFGIGIEYPQDLWDWA